MGQERDQRARMQMERERFAHALTAGVPQAHPRDRFGNAIQATGNVLYRPEVDLVFHVADVKPIMDPKMPPGMVGIRLVADFTLTVPFGQPLPRMIAIGAPQQAPAKEAPVEEAPAGEPAVEPSAEDVLARAKADLDAEQASGDTPLVTP